MSAEYGIQAFAESFSPFVRFKLQQQMTEDTGGEKIKKTEDVSRRTQLREKGIDPRTVQRQVATLKHPEDPTSKELTYSQEAFGPAADRVIAEANAMEKEAKDYLERQKLGRDRQKRDTLKLLGTKNQQYVEEFAGGDLNIYNALCDSFPDALYNKIITRDPVIKPVLAAQKLALTEAKRNHPNISQEALTKIGRTIFTMSDMDGYTPESRANFLASFDAGGTPDYSLLKKDEKAQKVTVQDEQRFAYITEQLNGGNMTINAAREKLKSGNFDYIPVVVEVPQENNSVAYVTEYKVGTKEEGKKLWGIINELEREKIGTQAIQQMLAKHGSNPDTMRVEIDEIRQAATTKQPEPSPKKGETAKAKTKSVPTEGLAAVVPGLIKGFREDALPQLKKEAADVGKAIKKIVEPQRKGAPEKKREKNWRVERRKNSPEIEGYRNQLKEQGNMSGEQIEALLRDYDYDLKKIRKALEKSRKFRKFLQKK